MVAAVGGARIDAAAETAGCAILAGVAVDHAIVVVVAGVLQPQAATQHPAIGEAPFTLNVGGQVEGLDLEVVMAALGEDCALPRAAFGGPELGLLQEGAAPVEVEAEDRQPGVVLPAERENRAGAVVAVVLFRPARPLMVEKLHIGMP